MTSPYARIIRNNGTLDPATAGILLASRRCQIDLPNSDVQYQHNAKREFVSVSGPGANVVAS